MSTPYGEITLARYPSRPNDDLRAYDGADAYLLQEIAERHASAANILVVGDRHGALTTALAAEASVTMWSDSELSRIAAKINLATNARSATVADSPPGGDFDLIVIRPGKARAMLAGQLHHIAGLIAPETPVVLGEMVKHLGRWMTDILETQIGPTSASLAHRKARLLRAVRDDQIGEAPEWTTYDSPDGITLHNAPGVFASSGIDRGSQLLLTHLPSDLGTARVADLGCGNGLLAIASAIDNPQARYLLVDESASAIDSARRSWSDNLGNRAVDLVQADGLVDVEPGSLDVVLCNPPFHVGTTIDEWFGQRLLDQAHQALRSGGELYVVANRHLHHYRYLRQGFGDVQTLASDAKFSVVKATR